MQRRTRGSRWRTRSARTGFTIVELLVVISVLALLAALLVPALGSSREAARRTSCRSHLRQIGLAFSQHETALRRLPSNGWGYGWVGDPDRGSDERQPGGWVYNILDFVDEGPLRKIGLDVSPDQKKAAMKALLEGQPAVFKCPSRPTDRGLFNIALAPHNAEWTPWAGKSDYAVNEGDFITDTGPGPATLAEGDSRKYKWDDVSKATGVCFLRSRVRLAQIRDGLSNTYLVGEKYIPIDHYRDDGDLGHDQCMFVGVDLDINRWTIDPPLQDGEQTADRRFGSAHPGSCSLVMCDGSVRDIAYNVDREVHRRLGHRQDGEVVELP